MELARDQERDDVDEVPGEIGISGGNMTEPILSLYHKRSETRVQNHALYTTTSH